MANVAYMKTILTSDEILEQIREVISTSSLRQVAKDMGISAPYLSDILLGRRMISENVARVLGYERSVKTEVVFKKVAR
jgi:transcriptional regulator with XRE-family HTH domain